MSITIDVIARTNYFLAIAERDSDEAIAKGPSEFAAASLALARLMGHEAPVQPTVGPAVQRRVAVSLPDIRRLVAETISNDDQLVIEYRDAEGVKTVRRIEPYAITVSDNVVSLDVAKGERRSFKLSRIISAEQAA